jgi:hypothetical protein
LTALYAAAKGWQSTAPVMATRLFERYMFVKHHEGWTYADYDAAAAGDIALDAEFAKVEAAFMDKAKKDKASG